MKFVSVLAVTLISASALALDPMIIYCQKGTSELNIWLESNGAATVEILGVHGIQEAEYDVKLDQFSGRASGDLLSMSDIADVQARFNSVGVVRLPRLNTLGVGQNFKADLQLRDYDNDYPKNQYRYEDRGPRANGYVLQPGSASGFACVRAD